MDSRELGFPKYMVYCGMVASLTSLSIGYVIGSPNVPEANIRGVGVEDCNPNGGFPDCFHFADLLWVSQSFRVPSVFKCAIRGSFSWRQPCLQCLSVLGLDLS